MFPSLRRRSFLIATVCALGAHSARAQSSAVVDEGTFMVTRNGAPFGRESFRIVRTPAPGGQVFLATTRSALGTTRLSTTLGTDSTGVPVSYEAEFSQNNQVLERLQGRGRPGRFSVLVQTKTGEAAREYALTNGALLIDEDVFAQFHFIGVAGAHTEFTLITPRSPQRGRFRFEERGQETTEIGGQSIASRHLALIGPSGASRDLWIDTKGRVLKVSIPEKGLVAVRDDPPR
jgi:hypothetical protein